jgi:hypothetical protein
MKLLKDEVGAGERRLSSSLPSHELQSISQKVMTIFVLRSHEPESSDRALPTGYFYEHYRSGLFWLIAARESKEIVGISLNSPKNVN